METSKHKLGYQVKSVKETVLSVPHLLTVIFFLLTLSNSEKFLVLLMACGYSVMEFFFTGGHTTIEQWFTNLAGIPLFLMWPIKYITNPVGQVTQIVNFDNGNMWMISFAIFPFLIWFLEIGEGIWLEFWHGGINPAWYYDTPDARFGGKIRWEYWIYWVGISICYHMFFWYIKM